MDTCYIIEVLQGLITHFIIDYIIIFVGIYFDYKQFKGKELKDFFNNHIIIPLRIFVMLYNIRMYNTCIPAILLFVFLRNTNIQKIFSAH